MRIGIIGVGWVGSSVAISTLQTGIVSELLLNDIKAGLAEGEAMDLAHGAAFYPTADVRAASVEEMRDCDAVVISAGRGGRPEETRLDLLRDNAAIVRDLAGRLRGLRGLLVMVTNPVDVLTQLAAEVSGLPASRVIGTGTMLDTARLRHTVGRHLNLDPEAVDAQVVGEHGDSEVVLWSGARVGGAPLRSFPGWDAACEARLATEVRCAAYEIIKRKGATNHAIGLVTATLLKWMLRGERRVLTISSVQQAVPGLPEVEGVALSLPTVVGASGIDHVIVPEMAEEEREALARSAEILRAARADLG